MILTGHHPAPRRRRSLRPCELATSSRVCAITAAVDLAVPTFPDEPKWTTVASEACPLDQGVVRLYHNKRVCAMAATGERHLDCCVENPFDISKLKTS